jgi:hypothetical protein
LGFLREGRQLSSGGPVISDVRLSKSRGTIAQFLSVDVGLS